MAFDRMVVSDEPTKDLGFCEATLNQGTWIRKNTIFAGVSTVLVVCMDEQENSSARAPGVTLSSRAPGRTM